jgi:hypothetical protein
MGMGFLSSEAEAAEQPVLWKPIPTLPLSLAGRGKTARDGLLLYYFQNEHLVSALVMKAWSPGMVWTTL